MRDHRKLTAFRKADALVVVEGAARSSHGECVNHLNVSVGSAAELAYLIDLSGRIYPHLLPNGNLLPAQAEEVIRVLVGLVDRLQSLKPKA